MCQSPVTARATIVMMMVRVYAGAMHPGGIAGTTCIVTRPIAITGTVDITTTVTSVVMTEEMTTADTIMIAAIIVDQIAGITGEGNLS